MYEMYEMIDGFLGLPNWAWIALGITIFYLVGAVISFGLFRGTTCEIPSSDGWTPLCERTSWKAFLCSWLGIIATICIACDCDGVLGFRFRIPKEVRNV